jgi:hypothetical protein
LHQQKLFNHSCRMPIPTHTPYKAYSRVWFSDKPKCSIQISFIN